MYPIRAQNTLPFAMDNLLAPISPDDPAGESLRYEGTYDRIGVARQHDDPILAQGVWKVAIKHADWKAVADMCTLAIGGRSKDLQIAAWLVEAWVHIHGFAGMRDGLLLITALCERYWDNLHPRSDTGDLEYKIAPLVWINEKLPVLLKLQPLTLPQSDDLKSYCWADWESACRPGQNSADQANSAAPTQALFQQSALLTPTEHFSSLLVEIEGSMDACAALEELLLERCDDEAPSLRQIWKVFESIRGFIVTTLSQRDVAVVMADDSPSPAALNVIEMDGASAAPAGEYAGPIRSRAEAYRRLAEAADYLTRTEPHSPTPYLVRRAVAWGGLRFEDLLPELVRNNAELVEVFRLLQINKTVK